MFKNSICLIFILGIFFSACKEKVASSNNAPFSYYWTSLFLDQGVLMELQKPIGSPSNCNSSPPLPAGIALNSNDCSISGIPLNSSETIEYKISSSGGQATTIRIKVTPSVPQVNYPNSSYAFIAGAPVDIRGIKTAGTITSCKISPELPVGLTINNSDCNISGSSAIKLLPTVFNITVQNFSVKSVIKLTLEIVTRPVLSISQSSPIMFERNKLISGIIFNNSESPTKTCSISPNLPTGLKIDLKTCAITGTPIVRSLAKTYTITASNIAGIGTYNLDLAVFSLSGLDASQLALIINDADPYSVIVGEYYRIKRNIPTTNIIHLSFTPKTQLSRVEFSTIKTLIDQKININTQAIAIAWLEPSRVECNSITSAISRGFMSIPCDAGGTYPTCGFGTSNPYYKTNSTAPLTDYGFRPSMLLAATSTAYAMAMIDKGINADKSDPTGNAHIMKTTDNIRSLRANIFPLGNLGTTLSPSVNVIKTISDSISSTTDTLFYFQGLQNVSNLTTNTFPPGAVADNLTSYGGMLTDSSQMSILRFTEAGATGSFGTVSEPCAYSEKFPDPSIMITQYTSGLTLIESYWKSISQTFQGLFVGEPLSNPWQKIILPINGSCGSANNIPSSDPPISAIRCSVGIASSSVNIINNKWNWSCDGVYDGAADVCSAPINKGLYGGKCAYKANEYICVDASTGGLLLTIITPFSTGHPSSILDFRNAITGNVTFPNLGTNSSTCSTITSGIICVTQGVTSVYYWQ
jgi:uncharacterized protein (TIGR03790 family)